MSPASRLNRTARRLRRIGAVTLLVATVAAALAVPGSAQAAAGYVARTDSCGTTRGGGSSDARGVLYAVCSGTVIRWDASLRRLAPISIANQPIGSVAPSPDGRFLYVSIGSRLKRLHVSGGAWRVDTTWSAARFTLGGATYAPVARNIKTDEFGNIYVSNAGVDPDTRAYSPNRILKFAPSGAILTAFGEWSSDITKADGFYQNRGLTVSRDGRMLFVTSHLHGVIKRFDLQPNGSYRYELSIGRSDTSCASAGGLAAVSDVGIDPWGYLYAPDTSCRKVKKFTVDGTYVSTIHVHGSIRLHEIAVSRKGEVYAGEWGLMLRRTAANPAPDSVPAITRPVTVADTAPVINSFTLPATTPTTDVTLTIDATDETAVTQMRFANEDGNWGPWMPYATTHRHTLGGTGYRCVILQVRDAGGKDATSPCTRTRVG